MITKELVEQALETSHTGNCRTETGCIHADGVAAASEAVFTTIASILMNPSQQDNPLFSLFYAGLHVGYRMHQLEQQQPIDNAKAN